MYESSHRLDMLLLYIKANTQVLNSLSWEFSSHPSDKACERFRQRPLTDNS